MAWTLPEKSNDNSKFLAPAGSHVALCYMVIDLGIQPGNGMYPQPKPQIFVSWELPFEIVEWEKDGVKHKGPKVVSKTYTASMGKKSNLRKDLEAWRGKAFNEGEASKFDIGTILGKPCMVNIVHKEKDESVYANVMGLSGIPKGTTVPSFSLKPIYYAPDDKSLYDDIPEWLRKKIDAQIKPEVKSAPVSPVEVQEPEYDESVPF